MKVIGFLRKMTCHDKTAKTARNFQKGLVSGVLVLFLSACQTISGFGEMANGETNEISNASSANLSSSENTLMGAGQEAEASRKYDVAANAFGRLFEKRPNDAKVLAAFMRNMRYSDRAKEIAQFVESKAQNLLGNIPVKFEYAKALLAAGRKGDALSILQELAVQSPQNWQVFSAMGITYDAMDLFAEAADSYGQALQISPGNVVVMNNLAMSQAMNGLLARAIKTLEKTASINRTNVHIRQNLALLYAVNGDVEKAKILADMDLDAGEVENNLSFYRRFEGSTHKGASQKGTANE